MTEYIPNNNAIATLATGLGSGATTAYLSSGQGSLFATQGDYRVRLEDASDSSIYELIVASARSGDTVTIQRGVEGTTPTTFATGDRFVGVITKAGLESYIDGAIQVVTNVTQLDETFSRSAKIIHDADGEYEESLSLAYNGSKWISETLDILDLRKSYNYLEPGIQLDDKTAQSFATGITATSGASATSSGLEATIYDSGLDISQRYSFEFYIVNMTAPAGQTITMEIFSISNVVGSPVSEWGWTSPTDWNGPVYIKDSFILSPTTAGRVDLEVRFWVSSGTGSINGDAYFTLYLGDKFANKLWNTNYTISGTEYPISPSATLPLKKWVEKGLNPQTRQIIEEIATPAIGYTNSYAFANIYSYRTEREGHTYFDSYEDSVDYYKLNYDPLTGNDVVYGMTLTVPAYTGGPQDIYYRNWTDGWKDMPVETTSPQPVGLQTKFDFSTANSYSITPTGTFPAGETCLLLVITQRDSATPSTPTITGEGLTYTSVVDLLVDDVGADRTRATLFRVKNTTANTIYSPTLTVDYAGTNQDECAVVPIGLAYVDNGGTNGSNAIVQSHSTTANYNAGTITGTLSPFAHVDNSTLTILITNYGSAFGPNESIYVTEYYSYNVNATYGVVVQATYESGRENLAPSYSSLLADDVNGKHGLISLELAVDPNRVGKNMAPDIAFFTQFSVFCGATNGAAIKPGRWEGRFVYEP